ncbi:hypothetical protein AB2M62_01390 [Sphingomonas sp. MMS12-HWE2-04]|uniref:hypothetical protein n=1 Tax=Sphingomonas sp. MMS12-HWE2-04 TaxID=3234199 RepID=UPI00384ED16B
MSVFEANSRYLLYANVTQGIDRKGRTVACVTPARIPNAPNLGIHRRRDGQRLDHIAERYLANATGFWRIAHHNGAMTVEQIADAPLVAIPVKGA